uniref:Protocadherin 2 alpha a 15 n=1 Tax=Labrus bergylta TaxID=56723 RepID=A0A3Q3E936_9LABR
MFCSGASAQLRYSIAEEVKEGSVVGNIAKDLGIDKASLHARDYRIVGSSTEPLFHLNKEDGILYVSRKVDREEICERSNACVINLKTVLQNPLEIHYVAIEVQNEHFRLEVKDRGTDGKIPLLYLHKPLDKETSRSHRLMLTAVDGGKPAKSGSMAILVNVLDVNDNMPVFAKDSYSAMLKENSPIGTTIMQVNATDLDDGLNGEVVYSFGDNVNNRLRKLFEVDPNTGTIIVKGQIDFEVKDRYEIDIKASDKGPVPLETEKSVVITIVDLNDNAPDIEVTSFSKAIPEDAKPGTTVALISVQDRDSGVNGKVICYISEDVPFTLTPSLQDNMYSIVTKSLLDREQQSTYDVTIIAKDGGEQPLSSQRTISVSVSDVNDNSPEFSTSPYTFYVVENNVAGASLFSVSAHDCDEADNALISYNIVRNGDEHKSFTSFLNINSENGVITALKNFEANDRYEIDIKASDKGPVPLETEKTVVITIVDLNDNAPDIEVTSFSKAIPEDSKPGTTVALISVQDRDSGVNGKVICYISEDVPFTLTPSLQDNMYSIVTKSLLDREQQSTYDVTIIAKDGGEQPLSSQRTISVSVSDVNDNSPEFSTSPYTFYVVENNVAGASLFSVSAHDCDEADNALISYNIVRNGDEHKSFTSFLNINSENGVITALKSFDFETVKTFQFQVVATDSGTPSLSSNVTVNVFILDQNDNAPVILYPVSSNGSAEGVEEIPRNVNAAHLVTKVRAYDADIGYNGWLLFSLQEVTEHSLFALDRYTGQIRTLRSFTETDEAEQKLVILVKDNGNVSLSATATVIVKVVEPKEAFAASDVKSATNDDEESNVTFYLMITLASVSALFLISIIVLIAMQCSKSTDYTSKYLQETNYDGTLCHSIQYRSGDKRYMLVGPRMSIGSTIVPGSHANTLVLPDRRRTSTEVR